jgi:hypothetical protein
VPPTNGITVQTTLFGTLGSINFPLPNVAGWISYGTCTIVAYFTWCPEHSDALRNLGRTIGDEVEPIATMNDMIDFVRGAKAQFDAIEPFIVQNSIFGMNGETGGAPPMRDMNGQVPVAPNINGSLPIDLIAGGDTANSPWFGGTLDLTYTDTTWEIDKAAVVANCILGGMSATLGEGAATAVCEMHYLITTNKFFIGLITVADACLIFFIVFKYLPAYIRRFFNLISGNRSMVGDIFGSI